MFLLDIIKVYYISISTKFLSILFAAQVPGRFRSCFSNSPNPESSSGQADLAKPYPIFSAKARFSVVFAFYTGALAR